MRKALAIAAGLAVLLIANVGIFSKKLLLRDGNVVLLELAPVDPRSLMQGDYMALDFQITRQAFGGRDPRRHADGLLLLARDARGVARLVGEYQGGPLQAGELLLRYRIRGHMPQVVTNAWFFEEGSGAIFEAARYGELRVNADGEALLVGMRDADLRRLSAPARER